MKRIIKNIFCLFSTKRRFECAIIKFSEFLKQPGHTELEVDFALIEILQAFFQAIDKTLLRHDDDKVKLVMDNMILQAHLYCEEQRIKKEIEKL